ncbi:MAG: GtrA family protein [Peptostreptococcaceae bacterium]
MNININKYSKCKETFLYLVFGVLSTGVNIGTYILVTRLTNLEFMIANIIAWVVAVLFAYLTNKLFVFKSKKLELEFLVKEFTSFISCRIFSLFIEMIIMYVMIDMLLINDIVVKVTTNIVVIVINYLLSKLIIFKKI